MAVDNRFSAQMFTEEESASLSILSSSKCWSELCSLEVDDRFAEFYRRFDKKHPGRRGLVRRRMMAHCRDPMVIEFLRPFTSKYRLRIRRPSAPKQTVAPPPKSVVARVSDRTRSWVRKELGSFFVENITLNDARVNDPTAVEALEERLRALDTSDDRPIDFGGLLSNVAARPLCICGRACSAPTRDSRVARATRVETALFDHYLKMHRAVGAQLSPNEYLNFAKRVLFFAQASGDGGRVFARLAAAPDHYKESYLVGRVRGAVGVPTRSRVRLVPRPSTSLFDLPLEMSNEAVAERLNSDYGNDIVSPWTRTTTPGCVLKVTQRRRLVEPIDEPTDEPTTTDDRFDSNGVRYCCPPVF